MKVGMVKDSFKISHLIDFQKVFLVWCRHIEKVTSFLPLKVLKSVRF